MLNWLFPENKTWNSCYNVNYTRAWLRTKMISRRSIFVVILGWFAIYDYGKSLIFINSDFCIFLFLAHSQNSLGWCICVWSPTHIIRQHPVLAHRFVSSNNYSFCIYKCPIQWKGIGYLWIYTLMIYQ